MFSEPIEAVDFPFVRFHAIRIKRPLIWLFIENPHDESNRGFRCPALIDTGADRSVAPIKLCPVLGHAFEQGLSESQAGGIGKGRIRSFLHSARITVLATPKNERAPKHDAAVFSPIDMELGFVEQDLPFVLLGQADFLQLFEYRQIRPQWTFSLRKIR